MKHLISITLLLTSSHLLSQDSGWNQAHIDSLLFTSFPGVPVTEWDTSSNLIHIKTLSVFSRGIYFGASRLKYFNDPSKENFSLLPYNPESLESFYKYFRVGVEQEFGDSNVTEVEIRQGDLKGRNLIISNAANDLTYQASYYFFNGYVYQITILHKLEIDDFQESLIQTFIDSFEISEERPLDQFTGVTPWQVTLSWFRTKAPYLLGIVIIVLIIVVLVLRLSKISNNSN